MFSFLSSFALITAIMKFALMLLAIYALILFIKALNIYIRNNS